jgi:predicted secreted protein
MADGKKHMFREVVLMVGENVLGHLRNFSFSETLDFGDTTCHDSTGKEKIPALPDWKGKADGLYVDQDAGQAAVRDAFSAKTMLTFKAHPEGDGAGKTEVTGDCYIANYEVSAGGISDPVAHNITIEGSGSLTWGVQAST